MGCVEGMSSLEWNAVECWGVVRDERKASKTGKGGGG